MNKIARLSNFELIRILAMFLIVLHHCLCHLRALMPVFPNTENIHFVNNFIAFLLFSGGKVGVAIFEILTGYFMISACTKQQKFFSLYLKTLLYSLVFLLCAILIGIKPNLSQIIHSFFPIGSNTYWFISVYLIFYLFIPYVNKLLLSINNKDFHFGWGLIATMTLLWVILPSFTTFDYFKNELIDFLYLYIIGASIKLSKFNFMENKRILNATAISIPVIFTVVYTLYIFFSKTQCKFHPIMYTSEINFFSVITAIVLFFYFKNLTIPQNKWINIISNSMFGVYLIHSNCFINPFKLEVFNVAQYQSSPYFAIKCITFLFIVFAVCLIIDLILSFLLKPISKALNDCFCNILEKITERKEVNK